MPSLGLVARHRVEQDGVARVEQVAGEPHRIVISDREALEMHVLEQGLIGVKRAHGENFRFITQATICFSSSGE